MELFVNNLFSLLCLGLQTKDVNEIPTDSFSEMSMNDWKELRTMADKQGVSAIVLDGLNSLVSSQGKEIIAPHIDRNWWQSYVFGWMGIMAQTEQGNQRQLKVLNELSSRWAMDGLQTMVFKGQASAILYPNPLHRCPGDIDCYLFDQYAKSNEIARKFGAFVDESWYKHSVISYKGESFENHQFFVHTRDGKRSKLLEKELEDALNVSQSDYFNLNESVLCPPIQWTAMFLTYHACAHFVSEGMRLKQILDWAIFLKIHQNDVKWPEFYAFCERHHLSRFVDVVTVIVKDYLGVQIINNNIRKKSSYTERVLLSTLYDEDLVFGSGKGDWYNRFHLVRNLWTYRWKYIDIYQMSPLEQLWYYITGFFFKTE